MRQEALVSISDASNMLGVSEAALRQWTDEGKIKAFITPGGHRRYSRTSLKKFMSSNQKMPSIKDLVTELEDTAQAHREIARSSLSNTSWYCQLDKDSQESLANLGRQILRLIIEYISEPSKRETVMKSVREVGFSFGATLARLGLPLTDSVEAFILHRIPIMNAATDLMKKREAVTGRVIETISLVSQIMDEALVCLVSTHQQTRNEIWNDAKGAISK